MYKGLLKEGYCNDKNDPVALTCLISAILLRFCLFHVGTGHSCSIVHKQSSQDYLESCFLFLSCVSPGMNLCYQHWQKAPAEPIIYFYTSIFSQLLQRDELDLVSALKIITDMETK